MNKKKIKKVKAVKSQSSREHEVVHIKHKFQDFGLTPEMDAVKLIFDRLDKFVADGFSDTFSTKLPGLKRVAVIQLCTRPQSESSVMLKYDEHV